jgi:hypothetical protein
MMLHDRLGSLGFAAIAGLAQDASDASKWSLYRRGPERQTRNSRAANLGQLLLGATEQSDDGPVYLLM